MVAPAGASQTSSACSLTGSEDTWARETISARREMEGGREREGGRGREREGGRGREGEGERGREGEGGREGGEGREFVVDWVFLCHGRCLAFI